MKIQNLSWTLGVGALALALTSCGQPKLDCTVGHAGGFYGYAATFTPKTDVTTLTSDCQALVISGDVIGLETYHPPTVAPADPGPDLTHTFVAIQTDSLGTLLQSNVADGTPDADTTHTAYAFGSFLSTSPDDKNLCYVTDLTAAQQVLSTDPDQGAPTASFKYEWRNVRNYVTADLQGTAMAADVTYTQDACVVDYHVVGLWPNISCYDQDAAGNLTANPLYCLANNDLTGLEFGSGINPDYENLVDSTTADATTVADYQARASKSIICDPDNLQCVFTPAAAAKFGFDK